MYGEFDILRNYCNINLDIVPTYTLTYQHGWHGIDKNILPEIIIGTNGRESQDKNRIQLVYRIDQELFLRNHGFKNAYAIGCPLIYLPKITHVKRIMKSILVVPMHTAPGVSDRVNEFDFCKSIEPYVLGFEKVTFLIHKNCVEFGLWIKNLEELGYSYIFGAGHNDESTYFRLAEIFSTYEWILSNHLGSHVPFSAFFGAKVCIIDDYHQAKKENYKYTPFSLGLDDNCKDILVNLVGKKHIKTTYPFLFNNCSSSFNFKDWANDELGLQCKKTPEDIKKILGWDFKGQLKLRINKYLELCRRFIIIILQFFIMSLRIGPISAFKFMRIFRSPNNSKCILPIGKTRKMFYFPTPKNRLLIRKVLRLP